MPRSPSPRLAPPLLALALALAGTSGCLRLGGGSPGDPAPELRLPREVVPLRYRLELSVAPEADRFAGVLDLDVELAHPLSRIWLHARELSVREAWVEAGGARTPATLAQVTPEGVARLVPEKPLPAGPATLHVAWDAPWNERLAGLYRVRQDGDAYAFTHLEPIDARRVFPGLDDPSFKAPFEVSLVVPDALVAVSNGPAVHAEPAGAGLKRVRFAPTDPLPTYLLFAAVGPFEVSTPEPLPANEIRGRTLPLRGLSPRGTGQRHARALAIAREVVPWLERWFDVPYPYAKLDQVVAPDMRGSGMENAGAVLYSDAALSFEPGRSPPEEEVAVAGLVAHELAHQWFGDLVTLAWWDDVWLNESFATFMTWKALEALRPAAGARERAAERVDEIMAKDALASARAVRQPLRRMADVGNQFDRLSYWKGGAVLRGFERWIGPDRFREGVRAHLRDRAHGTATTDDLLGALSRAAGRDVGRPMKTLLDQPGIPLVTTRIACDGGRPRIEVEVSRWRPVGSRAQGGAWDVPVCARFEAAGEVGEACALVEHGHGTLALRACPRWVMPAAGGAGYQRWWMPAADLTRLRDAGFAHLEPAERLSYAQAVSAAARAGALPYGEALTALQPLVRDGSRRVALAPAGLLEELVRDLVPEEGRPRARRAAAELFRPRLREVGLEPAPGEDAERAALRRGLAEALVLVARDPETTRVLAALGRAYAGGDGRFHPEAVAPELAEVALSAAVMESDTLFAEALAERLATVSAADLRGRVLDALGAARTTPTSLQVLKLVGDPRLRVGERARTLFEQARWPETRDAAWRALEARWTVLAAQLPAGQAARLPSLAGALCERSRLEPVRRFLERRVDEVPGARREADEGLERLELCAALRDAQGASAAAWVERR
ncbi:MAG TPA: M1 family aminopeptidase [Anaeromyxobacteraceae bacterium]|nr:M1 family aminopeptidase [Anaeromyxobacteraceae bacterium]